MPFRDVVNGINRACLLDRSGMAGVVSQGSITMNTFAPHTKKMSESDEAQRHSEGPVARAIEDQTAQLPSDTFLWAAGAAIAGSLALKASGKDHAALFVGQWVAPFLILGLYNKIVKVAGSDRVHA
jgi:hypothetical protein